MIFYILMYYLSLFVGRLWDLLLDFGWWLFFLEVILSCTIEVPRLGTYMAQGVEGERKQWWTYLWVGDMKSLRIQFRYFGRRTIQTQNIIGRSWHWSSFSGWKALDSRDASISCALLQRCPARFSGSGCSHHCLWQWDKTVEFQILPKDVIFCEKFWMDYC